jgi:quercetin dioxygenase-like cupin family protein
LDAEGLEGLAHADARFHSTGFRRGEPHQNAVADRAKVEYHFERLKRILMNRREFSALLPLLVTASACCPAEAQNAPAAASLSKLESGQFVEGAARGPSSTGRTQSRLLLGMLPDNIRLEAHVTTLAPGAPPEPIEHHKHTEIWLVREGAISLLISGATQTIKAGDMGLCIAGDEHSVSNASKTEPASYFVVTVGPPE